MSDWVNGHLADSIAGLDAGVSVNAEDRPHGAGEIGVLKTSAVNGGKFYPEQNKTVVERERRLVAESVQGDSILVSRMNTPALVGESCYVRAPEPSLFLPDRLWQLKPKDRSIINMRWLSFVLQSSAYRRYVEIHATGTSGSMKNLPKSKLLALPVSYPVPKEQAKISQILDTLDTTIHETEAIIAKLKAVKQGLLHDLLTRGIDANGELRSPQAEAPHLYKDSPLGWIPKEWDFGTVASYLATDQGIKPGPFGSSIKKDFYSESGFKVYGQEQVISADQNIGDYFVPLRKFQELQDFAVQVGDVLISLVGTIGRVIVLKKPLAPGLINPRLMRLRPDKQIADSEFVGFLIASDLFVKQVIANAGGGTMPVINKRIISNIRVPVVPLHEQLEILQRRAAVDQRISYEVFELKKLLKKKAGLMDDLLTGRVRVTPLLEHAAS